MRFPVLKYYAESLAQLFFPLNCAGCGNALMDSEEILCLPCQTNLPLTNSWESIYNIAEQKFWGRISILQAHSFLYFTKQGITQHLIHQLKYSNRKDIGIHLGKMFALQLKQTDFLNNIDFQIPVPLHPKKKRQRGYNQSEKIGEGIEQIVKIPILKDCLIKTKNTSSQTNKTTIERIENVKNVFSVSHPEKIEGKNILLIDDVLTTGSTLESCVLTLHEAAKVTINIATLGIVID